MNKPLDTATALKYSRQTLRTLLEGPIKPHERGRLNAIGNTCAYLIIDGGASSELVGLMRASDAVEAGGRANYLVRLAEAQAQALNYLAR